MRNVLSVGDFTGGICGEWIPMRRQDRLDGRGYAHAPPWCGASAEDGRNDVNEED